MRTTATEMMQDQASRRLQIALVRLFDGLRKFVRVHPIHRDEKMPEHDVVWVDEFKSGPAQTLRDAIAQSPELWAHAIPDGYCIVQRDMLTKYLGADAAEALAGYGAVAVDNHAARHRHEAEDRERRDSFKRNDSH